MNIILTLADDRSIIESLRATLPRSDLLLFEHDVQDALRRLIAMRADVILLDDAKQFGIPALRQLTETAPATPVIVLTSTRNPESHAAYTMAGARECVTKPFKCEDLEHAIQQVTTPAAPPNGIARFPKSRAASGTSIAQHQMALRWMSRTIAHFEDTTRLFHSLIDALIDIFDPARACVLLQTNGSVRVTASHGLPDNVISGLRLTFSHGLMHRFEEATSLVERDQAGLPGDVVKEMQALGGRMAVPLVSRGRACGAVVVGEKASGADFSSEEKDLLTIMARCVSTCLDRAQRYRDTTRQQNRLDAVLANITAGVVTIAPDKTISMMNAGAERALQLRATDVLGRSVQKLGSAFADVVLRSMHSGKPSLRRKIKDPAINATLGLSVTPLGSEGVVAIFSILPTGQEEGGIAYSPIWEFLSNRIAQEIKNPMVAINTFAQLLPSRYESEEFRDEFSTVVQKEVERINNVVDALYEFAGHARLTLAPSDLSDNVRKILRRFDKELAARTIRLETHFEQEETPVNIDEQQFARAVENVIQNCIEAMPDGGTLKVTTLRENGNCLLTIADTGEGIKDEDAALIFTPFFSTKQRGMGLGLTMASRILEEHEGHLGLITDPEGGGAFLIDLPRIPSSS